jgi:hypothetical protein
VIGSLEFAMGCVSWVGRVVKAAVGQGTAEALVEEQEQEGHLNAFGGEPVGISGAIALQQIVPLQVKIQPWPLKDAVTGVLHCYCVTGKGMFLSFRKPDSLQDRLNR